MDRIDPAEPMDRIEPPEPIDSIEPGEPIDSIDPGEPIDSIDPGEPVNWMGDRPVLCMDGIIAAPAQALRRILGSMPVRLHHIVVDAHDLPRLARFWTQALGWAVLSERPREVIIGPDENAPVGMCFMPVSDEKTVKNRVHLDLTTGASDRDEEIEPLLALGARRVDIGQTGAESWTVLADPEGNEFCVIRPKNTLIS